MEQDDILKDFIAESHERLKDIFLYIEGENPIAAAYACGQLESMHRTLLEVFGMNKDEDADDDEDCEECCDMAKFLSGLRSCKK